jgi:multiple sugar transport system permease protein
MKAKTILIHILAYISAGIWLLPFAGIFMASIRPFYEILDGWWVFNEFNPSLNNYFKVWNHEFLPLSTGVMNSFIIAIPSTIIPLLVGALAAYGFARFSFPVRHYLFLTIVILMAMPQQSVAIPLYMILKDIGLLNNYLGLILVHSAWGLPWIILFLRNYFLTLPIEVEEAARVDGASDFKIFYKIVLPMSIPALISVVALQFMWVWNDFFLALIIINDDALRVATQRLPYIGKSQYHVDWGMLSAGSIIVMLVPVLVFALLQRYYIKGMTGWAVKG